MYKLEIVLKQIVKQEGIHILAQSRLISLILDLMPTAERKHINVIKRAIDEQIGVRLLEMQHDEPAVRQIKVNTLKEKFKNDNAFDDTACYIIDCFLHALGWVKYENENIDNQDELLNNRIEKRRTSIIQRRKILYGLEITPTFKEIKIGNQIWADRNLDLNHFRNGEPIPEAKTDGEWRKAGDNKQPAWCYYDNDPDKGKKHGKLYNWYAVNDPRGLSPEGWHVPTYEEWEKLIEYLGKEENAGAKLKRYKETMKEGNDSYELSFNPMPRGSRNYYGSFSDFGKYCTWWSNTFHDIRGARACFFVDDDGLIFIGISNKVNGYSIRCLKN